MLIELKISVLAFVAERIEHLTTDQKSRRFEFLQVQVRSYFSLDAPLVKLIGEASDD